MQVRVQRSGARYTWGVWWFVLALVVLFQVGCGSPSSSNGGADASMDGTVFGDGGIHTLDGGLATDGDMGDGHVDPDGALSAACDGKLEGDFCNDGNLCTFGERCVSGVCSQGTLRTCGDPDVCQVSVQCNPNNGFCESTNRPDGTACDDGNQCTGGDQCTSGSCEGSVTPPTSTACEDGICFSDVATSMGLGGFGSAITGGDWIGASAGWIDVNQDGRLDALLGTELGGLFLYVQQSSGVFLDETTTRGIPVVSSQQFTGFAAADYDNDGDTDIYVTLDGPNLLLQNDGTGMFADVAAMTGVNEGSWSTSGAFGDYDRDGDLDLYVGNYVAQLSFPNHTPYPNVLYRNNGNGTFTDVTTLLGVAGTGTTLMSRFTDYDGDGWIDLLVCNDFGATVQSNRLYRNMGGTFADVSSTTGMDVGVFCMGLGVGDPDRDGDLDYALTNIGNKYLLRNDGSAFTDVALASGVQAGQDMCIPTLLSTSWTAAFVDFDQDGWEDLYYSNGHIPADDTISNAVHSRNQLFRNLGVGLSGAGPAFQDVSESARVEDGGYGRGTALGDMDGDGDVDILQLNLTGAPVLWRNDSPTPGHYVRFMLRGRESPKTPMGAQVQVHQASATQLREYNPNRGYLSVSEPSVHFGMGTDTQVEMLTVMWPSGQTQHRYSLPVDTTLDVLEPWVWARPVNAPSQAQQGSAIMISGSLESRSSTSVNVTYQVFLDVDGQTFTLLGATAVSANPTTATPFSTTVNLPVLVLSAQTIGRVRLHVSDNDGAVDEITTLITVTP